MPQAHRVGERREDLREVVGLAAPRGDASTDGQQGSVTATSDAADGVPRTH